MTNVQTLADRLQTMLSAGDLCNAGRLPPERQLAEKLGVSRAKLRQALEALESSGTVYRQQGRGTFAMPPTQNGSGPLGRLAREVTPQDVMEVRFELEPALAAYAAARARKQDIERLEQVMLATLEVDERQAYEIADDIFHYQVAVTAKNPLFLELFDSIRTVRKLAVWSVSRRNSHTPEVMARFGLQHRTLFEAIAAKDASEAARQMEMHLVDVNRAVLRSPTKV